MFPTFDAEPSEGIAGATITLTDAEGRTATLTSDAAGNFWTDVELVFPIEAEIAIDGQTQSMPVASPSGSCNTCHSHPDPNARAVGRLRAEVATGSAMLPGDDCLRCHAPPTDPEFDPAPPWTVGGTVFDAPPGARVEVRGEGAPPVLLPLLGPGNFYSDAPLAPPFRAAIVLEDGTRREKQVPVESGACNACHREGGEAAVLSGG